MTAIVTQAGSSGQEAPYPTTTSVPRWALFANSPHNSQKTNVTVACDMAHAPGSELFAGRVKLCREPASRAASKRGHIQDTAKVQQLKAAGKCCDECWRPAYFVRIGLGLGPAWTTQPSCNRSVSWLASGSTAKSARARLQCDMKTMMGGQSSPSHAVHSTEPISA